MTEASVSFAGNLTDQPELRHTEAGIARAMFRVAVSGRREQEASFFTVIVWRDQAEHAAESLSKGSRVVVVGRLQQRPLQQLGPLLLGLRWGWPADVQLRVDLQHRPAVHAVWLVLSVRPQRTGRMRIRGVV